MADFQTNPNIPLMAQVANPLAAVQSGLQLGQQIQQMPLQNQLLQQKAQQQSQVIAANQLAVQQAEDNRRLLSVATSYSGVKDLVDAGKYEDAAVKLEENKKVMTGQGITNFEETDFAINALRSNDATAINQLSKYGESVIEHATAQGLGSFGDSGLTAGEQEFESLIARLSDKDKEKARRIKLGLDARAMGSAAATIAETGKTGEVAASEAVIAGEKAAATETKKLSAQLNLKPEVEAAVVKAVGQAKADVKIAGDKRSNEIAFDVYETATSNLVSSLGGTTTGPGAGFLPAVTSSAQIANGAVAMMAPVLKQLFRGAGEGTFTDQDQKMLLALVPTRNTHPDARTAQLAAIDSLVRAKLQIKPDTGGNAGGDASGQDDSKQQRLKELRLKTGL